MTKKNRVLVIDDDLDMCALIANTAFDLEMECITTVEVEDFFKAFTTDVNLVILDLLMPKTDGVEILRILGRNRCQAGIVVMSGVGKRVIETAEELATSLGLSIVGHLAKPFSVAQLEDILLRNPAPPGTQASKSQPPIAFERAEISKAIQQDELVLYYQPKIDIVTGRCLGVEALVRWQHPIQGLVAPNRFIKLAEEFNLIDELSWTIFRKGLAEMGQLAHKDGEPLSLSFNLSVLSLSDLTFPDNLIALLKEFDVQPKHIILEITETSLLCEFSRTLDVLIRLRMKGIRLSIDDFGTGYSMMEQLRHIPANELKVDQSMLRNLHIDNHRVIVQKIIELARELNVISVAEGVETREQLAFLRSKSCDIAQGYFFSRPVSKPEFLAWLRTYQESVKSSYPGRF